MGQGAEPAVEEEEGGFDFGRLVDWTSYGVRAVRRHWLAVLVSAFLVLAAALILADVIPDRYYVEARILAQRPDVNAILSTPGRPQATDAIRAVDDIVTRRDNLLALIGQTGLLQQWRSSRSRLFRLKDRIVFGRELDDEELTEVLVGVLGDRLGGGGGRRARSASPRRGTTPRSPTGWWTPRCRTSSRCVT